jgi:hypothetical protein
MAESSPLFGFDPSATTVTANYGQVAKGKEDIANAAAKAKSEPQPFDFLGVGQAAVSLTGELASIKNAADAHKAKQKYIDWMGTNQHLSGTQLVDAITSEIASVSDTNNFSSGYREGALSILEYGMQGAIGKAEEERINAGVAVTASEFSVAHQRAIREGLPINLEEYTKRVSAERRLPVTQVRDALMYSNLNDDITLLNAAESVDEYLSIKKDIAARDKAYAESVSFYGSQSAPVKQGVTAQRNARSDTDKATVERLISNEREKIDASLSNLADTNGISIRKQALDNIRKLDPSVYDSERRRVDSQIESDLLIQQNRSLYSDPLSIVTEAAYSKDKPFFMQQTSQEVLKALSNDDMTTLNTIIMHRPSIVKDISKEISKEIFSSQDENSLANYISIANKLPRESAQLFMSKDAYELQESIDVLSGFARDKDGVTLSAVRLRDTVMNSPEKVTIANEGLQADYYEKTGALEANTSLKTGAVDEYQRLYRLLYTRSAETNIQPDKLAGIVHDYVEKKYTKVEVDGLELQTADNNLPESFVDYAVSVVSAVHPNITKNNLVIRGGNLRDPYTKEPVYTAYVKTSAGLQHIPNINLTKGNSIIWRMIDEPPASLADNTDYSQYGIPMAAQAGGAMSVADLIDPEGLAESVALAARGQRQGEFELVQQITNSLVVQNGKLVNPEDMQVITDTAINVASELVQKEKAKMVAASQGIPVEAIPTFSATPSQDAIAVANATSAIDYEFISGLEGKLITKGYVPTDKSGKALDDSGVTVSTGVDLGQWDEAGLLNIGVPKQLVNKLKPYFGLRGDAAIKAASKLSITEEEAQQLYQKVKTDSVNNLKKEWANSKSTTSWNNLTNEQKTVLASVAFQYGSLAKKTPTFWRYATSGDWDMVLAELRDFKDSYPTRRNKEADYLEGED